MRSATAATAATAAGARRRGLSPVIGPARAGAEPAQASKARLAGGVDFGSPRAGDHVPRGITLRPCTTAANAAATAATAAGAAPS